MELSLADLRSIVSKIRSTRANTAEVVFVERLTNTTSLVAVLWNEVWFPVVYQRDRREIRTILPASVLEERGFRPPRQATPEEQTEDFLVGRKIRTLVNK